ARSPRLRAAVDIEPNGRLRGAGQGRALDSALRQEGREHNLTVGPRRRIDVGADPKRQPARRRLGPPRAGDGYLPEILTKREDKPLPCGAVRTRGVSAAE